MSKINTPPMSYIEYKAIIINILATGKYRDYADVMPEKPFIVLRHDIEFSPERALKMQEIENSLNFKSSYFFQITNNTYNAFSKKNTGLIKEIYANGHHVGLHYHLNGKTDLEDIADDIKLQSRVMSEMLGILIDRFSFHRPTKDVLRANIEVAGLINTYNPLFFTFAEKMEAGTRLDVKYTADSMHKWSYGFPNEEMLNSFPQMQILVHPYSWTLVGYDNLENFKTLIQEKNSELVESINSECKHFQEVRYAL